MKIITIGGLPAAGKTYTSKLIAQQHNFLSLELEPLRWDFFDEDIDENLYRYTKNSSIYKNENMREYYMRCALYERKIPFDLLVECHRDTMKFISDKVNGIIDELELCKNEEDYVEFCNKYESLINYMPKYKELNNNILICSHAFINTINFQEERRIRINFVSDLEILMKRFKDREKITEIPNENLILYYKSYQDVLNEGKANILDTTDINIMKKIDDVLKS